MTCGEHLILDIFLSGCLILKTSRVRRPSCTVSHHETCFTDLQFSQWYFHLYRAFEVRVAALILTRCMPSHTEWIGVFCTDPCNCRESEGIAMASRIAELVNAALQDEGESVQLGTSEILDLIDLGRSEGGSEVCFSMRIAGRSFKSSHMLSEPPSCLLCCML